MIESPTRISSLAITIVVIFSIAVLEIDFSNFSQAQAQDRSMCDPNDSSVNATESKICGVPMTIKNATTTSSIPSQ